MRMLRGIMIVTVFLVAASLFAYIAFVHPIGTQFVRGKVTEVVAQAKKIVQEPVRKPELKPQKAEPHTPPPPGLPAADTTVVAETPPVHPATGTGTEPAQPVAATAPAPVTKTTRSRRIENPFKLERSEFSRADIDAIIEQRRRIKEKLGQL